MSRTDLTQHERARFYLSGLIAANPASPTGPLKLQYPQKVYRLLSRWFNIRSRKKLEEICNMRFAFNINPTAAQANSLEFSSKLLKLALQIY
jgi:hypothetical protein